MSKESPIFSKTYDLLLWLLNHTDHFPKNERFRMGRRLEDAAFAFYDLLIEAARRPAQQEALQRADLELHRLRLYLRLSQARGTTTLAQYRHAAEMLAEIGRLLGGWQKKAA